MSATAKPAAPEKVRAIPQRYNLKTYMGRYRHFMNVIDPICLVTSEKRVREAEKFLDDWKHYRTPEDVPIKKVWHEQKLVNGVLHHDTNEKIDVICRMAGYVPVGVPIAAGMLTAKTMLGNAFFQAINQTQKAFINYGNRPINLNRKVNENEAYMLRFGGLLKEPFPLMKTAVKSYLSAVTAAVGVCLSGRALAMHLKSPTFLTVVPCVSVIAAVTTNLVLMRFPELSRGIDVFDENGNKVGISKRAAFQAIRDTAISRAFLPIPVLLLPPPIIKAIRKLPSMISYCKKFPRSGPKVIELTIVTIGYAVGLPGVLALYPQKGTLNREHFDASIKGLKDVNGKEYDKLYYNKGL